MCENGTHRARYYDPGIGRFTTVDPAMDDTNWYVYCKGNPIAFVDPWGMCYYDSNGNWCHDTWEYIYKYGKGYYGAASSHEKKAERDKTNYGNCYSFAVGLKVARDPGYKTSTSIYDKDVTTVASAVISDLNKAGRTARIIDGADGEIYGNEYRIALRVGGRMTGSMAKNDPIMYEWDYHFMVQNSDERGLKSTVGVVM